MEKLLKLLNEYEESRWTIVDDGLTEEEREAGIVNEENPTWKEYEGHLRHCNANTVAYEKATFDYRALSRKYGFIQRLYANDKIDRSKVSDKEDEVSYSDLLSKLALLENPINYLIAILN